MANDHEGNGRLGKFPKFPKIRVPKGARVIKSPSSGPGVNTPRQYAKFHGIYPRFGRGFPRRYVDITPQEILYDERILGDSCMPCDRSVQREPTGETVLRQPRVETERIVEYRKFGVDPNSPAACPPPYTQLPVIKKQIHIDPSRDAEILFTSACGDIPANGSATLLRMETWNNLRTFIRWLDFFVGDALCPPNITLQIRIEGQPIKFAAMPTGSTIGTQGEVIPGTVTTPTAIDFQCLPKDFHNSLLEITDRRLVEFVIANTEPVDRFVRLCVWGWIESITKFDQCVRR